MLLTVVRLLLIDAGGNGGDGDVSVGKIGSGGDVDLFGRHVALKAMLNDVKSTHDHGGSGSGGWWQWWYVMCTSSGDMWWSVPFRTISDPQLNYILCRFLVVVVVLLHLLLRPDMTYDVDLA